jgi:hypothetical protein
VKNVLLVNAPSSSEFIRQGRFEEDETMVIRSQDLR